MKKIFIVITLLSLLFSPLPSSNAGQLNPFDNPTVWNTLTNGQITYSGTVLRANPAYLGLMSGWNGVLYDLYDSFSGLYQPTYVSGTMPEISPSLTPAEMVTNGGLETLGAGGADVYGTWVETAGSGAIANETTIKRTGSNAAKLTYVTDTSNIAQTFTSVFPGLVYNLTIWTAGDASVAGQYQVYDVSNSVAIKALGTTGVTSASYTQVTYQFTVPKGCYSVRVDLYSPASAGSAYFDDISLQLAPNQAKRMVTDTEGKVSVDNSGYPTSVLRFSGGKATPAWGDPGLWEPPVARAAGRMLIAQARRSSASATHMIGFDNAASGDINDGLYFSAGNIVTRVNGSGGPIVGAQTVDTDCVTATIARSSGCFLMIKGGQYPNWTMLWMHGTGNASPLYPVISNYASVLTSDYLRIPTTLWLPTPLISDGFSGTDGALLTSRTTDGLGHAEGIAGGIGSGGSGQTWLGSSGSIVAATGRAKITPVLGSELVTNGTFDTDTGWTSVGSSRLSVAGGISGNCLEVTYASSPCQTIQDITTEVGKYYKAEVYIKSGTSGNESAKCLIYTGSLIGTSETKTTSSSWVLFPLTFRATLTSNTFILQKVGTAVGNMLFDSASVKPLTLSSLFSSIQASTSNVLAGLDIWMTSGTQAGLVTNLDSATTPANFIISYHDGTNAKIDTCIAGVYTNRISAAATYVAGARLRVITDTLSDGSFTVDLYYNDAKVGSTYTAANGSAEATAYKANMLHGIFSTYDQNTTDNLVIYPRGTERQYNALDNF